MLRRPVLDPPLDLAELTPEERTFVEQCASGEPGRNAERRWTWMLLAVAERRRAKAARVARGGSIIGGPDGGLDGGAGGGRVPEAPLAGASRGMAAAPPARRAAAPMSECLLGPPADEEHR